MYFLLMKNDIELHIAKKKNIGAGFDPGRFAFTIGNSNILSAEHPQLTIVENGRKEGSTISGIYIQTIGPRLKLKLAM